MKKAGLIIFICVHILSNFTVAAQTITVEAHGNTSIKVKNGRIKTKGDVIIGSGNVVEKAFPCKSIHSVAVDGSMDITWLYAEKSSIVIEGDDNIVDLFNVRVSSGTVRLNPERSFVSNTTLRATVYSPAFKRLTLNGSGNAVVNNCVATDFWIETNGSGDVTIAGTARNLHIRSTGSGDIDGSGCHAQSVNLLMEGAGDVQVSCAESVEGRMDGAGDLTVYGDAIISVINEGAGDIFR